jgi:hypothetical protein
MPRGSAALAPRKPVARSRISNGSDLLPGIDGRSATARRYRDVLFALTSDSGGADNMSEARLQLCRRFAAASVLAEQMEAKLANGGKIAPRCCPNAASTCGPRRSSIRGQLQLGETARGPALARLA